MLFDDAKELIRKYNRPGPRYTSYPTALQFAPVDDPAPLLESTRNDDAPLSLYFHLPFCESLCWFCACTTVITRNPAIADPYIQRLTREMDLLRAQLKPGRRVEQLHFGGGSPSFLTPAQLRTLCSAIRERFAFTEDAEISAELDPRTLSAEKVAVLAEFGFNRASFGIQDVRPEVQKAVHRIQPDSLNRQCIQWVREAGIPSVNIDLIYGLPLQTPDSFAETLQTAIDYQPDRLAVFSYAHVPWVAPAQKILERSQLPEPPSKFAMLLNTIDTLSSSGFTYIGMDHFARDDDELVKALHSHRLHRNFQGYSTKAGSELLAFGMSAISQNANAYRQNAKDLNDWSAAIDDGRLPITKGYVMTAEDRLRKAVIMDIMCSGWVDFTAVNQRFGIDFNAHFADARAALQPAIDDGLLEWSDAAIKVTPNGRLLLRNIAMPFDAYLKPSENRHAKTI